MIALGRLRESVCFTPTFRLLKHGLEKMVDRVLQNYLTYVASATAGAVITSRFVEEETGTLIQGAFVGTFVAIPFIGLLAVSSIRSLSRKSQACLNEIKKTYNMEPYFFSDGFTVALSFYKNLPDKEKQEFAEKFIRFDSKITGTHYGIYDLSSIQRKHLTESFLDSLTPKEGWSQEALADYNLLKELLYQNVSKNKYMDSGKTLPSEELSVNEETIKDISLFIADGFRNVKIQAGQFNQDVSAFLSLKKINLKKTILGNLPFYLSRPNSEVAAKITKKELRNDDLRLYHRFYNLAYKRLALFVLSFKHSPAAIEQHWGRVYHNFSTLAKMILVNPQSSLRLFLTKQQFDDLKGLADSIEKASKRLSFAGGKFFQFLMIRYVLELKLPSPDQCLNELKRRHKAAEKEFAALPEEEREEFHKQYFKKSLELLRLYLLILDLDLIKQAKIDASPEELFAKAVEPYALLDAKSGDKGKAVLTPVSYLKGKPSQILVEEADNVHFGVRHRQKAKRKAVSLAQSVTGKPATLLMIEEEKKISSDDDSTPLLRVGDIKRLSSKEIIEELVKAGFFPKNQKGSHQKFIGPNGARTTVPVGRSSGQMGWSTVRNIREQVVQETGGREALDASFR